MSFPRQFTEVPAGKIAAIVTSLEMFSAPAPRPERSDLALSLRRIEQPDLDWFRALFRRTGEDWLWFSRLAMTDDALRAIIHDPAVEVYPLMAGEQEAGLLELDFPRAGRMRAQLLRPLAAVHRIGRRTLADEPRDRARLVAARTAVLGPHLHLRSPGRALVLSSLGLPRIPA